MTIGFSLSLTLGAGLYADSGPAVVKGRFQAAWGRTEVFVANTTPWDIARARAWRHAGSWSIRFAHRLRATYGLRVERGCRHPYGAMRVHRVVMAAAYWITQTVAARHALGYDVADVDPVASRLAASWSLLADARLQAVVNTPELFWQGRAVRILEATLSCDEDSPVWLARITVADLSAFAQMGIGDAIRVVLGQEAFALVIDGKTLSRPDVADRRMDITAVSPVALLDAPFAGDIYYSAPDRAAARAIVESLIGPVDWRLPDWIIPAGRLSIYGATPLAAVRAIISAIGGLIESQPDGSILCRRRHPVSIPQYGQAGIDHSLFDADVIAVEARIAPSRGFNRVTIANEDGGAASSADRIEFVRDPDDPYRGTVRAWLARPRPVTLAHTGHADTVIARLGETTRIETETVEFIEGRASARYPVAGITRLVWQRADLGSVIASGANLESTTPGYSLARITYTTTSLDWRVALQADEEVQFVLLDQ